MTRLSRNGEHAGKPCASFWPATTDPTVQSDLALCVASVAPLLCPALAERMRPMPLDLSTRRVMVTGGSGFVGQRLVAKLRERDVTEIFVPRSAQYNLVERDAC